MNSRTLASMIGGGKIRPQVWFKKVEGKLDLKQKN